MINNIPYKIGKIKKIIFDLLSAYGTAYMKANGLSKMGTE